MLGNDVEGKCRMRGGNCLSRGDESRCSGDCWSNFCGHDELRRCCIPDSVAEGRRQHRIHGYIHSMFIGRLFQNDLLDNYLDYVVCLYTNYLFYLLLFIY